MLKTLYIKNFTLLEELKVEFGPGFNVLTGETGAGKSIIIEAISFLLGDRGGKDLIRAGSDQCVVEATFYIEEKHNAKELNQFLKANDITNFSDNSLIIRRTISSSGSSRQFINDVPTSVGILKNVRELLVDIHSANEHQQLLKPEYQLALLDEYAGLALKKAAYEEVFHKYSSLKKELSELSQIGDEEALQQLDFLKGQIAEFKDEVLTAEEERNIIEEHKLFANREEIHRLINELLNTLSDDEFSLINRVAQARKAIEKLSALGVDRASFWHETLEDIATRTRDLVKDISSKGSDMEFDEARFKWLEERLALYYRFKRKFGLSMEEAQKNFEQIKEKIKILEERSEKIKEKTCELTKLENKLKELGSELSNVRRNIANKLAQDVLNNMKALKLPDATFTISISECNEPKKNGYDQVEFLFSANVGVKADSLRNVASSGELSRAMLAIKSSLANYDKTPLLIFDEIDMNIGGMTANAVANKLKMLAQNHQLICITHLPQVASKADHHFAVSKIVKDNQTIITLEKLDGIRRTQEMHRMFGAEDYDSATNLHARDILDSLIDSVDKRKTKKSAKKG